MSPIEPPGLQEMASGWSYTREDHIYLPDEDHHDQRAQEQEQDELCLDEPYAGEPTDRMSDLFAELFGDLPDHQNSNIASDQEQSAILFSPPFTTYLPPRNRNLVECENEVEDDTDVDAD